MSMVSPTPIDPEETRLQIEQLRLQQEETRIFLEQWKLDVVDRRDKQITVFRSSVDMAMLAFRSVFLLNGGAMIAIPTFGKLVDSIAPEALRTALVWFGFGLGLSALAMLFAYVALDTQASAWREGMDQSAAELKEERALFENKGKHRDIALSANANQVHLNRRAGVFQFFVFIMALASLGAFVRGAFVGAQMLSG